MSKRLYYVNFNWIFFSFIKSCWCAIGLSGYFFIFLFKRCQNVQNIWSFRATHKYGFTITLRSSALSNNSSWHTTTKIFTITPNHKYSFPVSEIRIGKYTPMDRISFFFMKLWSYEQTLNFTFNGIFLKFSIFSYV